jgi:hypothetical protein
MSFSIDLALEMLKRMEEGQQAPHQQAIRVLGLLGSTCADIRRQGAELLASSDPEVAGLVGFWASQALHLHQRIQEDDAYQRGRQEFLTGCVAGRQLPPREVPEWVSHQDQVRWLLGYWGMMSCSEQDISPELLRPEIRRTPGSKGKSGSDQ